MGGFFDPRKYLRTPGFAEDGLYDEQDEGLPPLPDRIARPDEQPSQMGLSGMLAAAPAAVAPIRDIQPRQRITLPDAPLPPKVGKMRQVLGTATELYLPQVGQQIRQPGYDRMQREYGNKVAKLQMEAKLNEAAAQEGAHEARTRAEMARAEAQSALKKRTEAQMALDGNFTLSGDQARFNASGGRIASNPLPPKPNENIPITKELGDHLQLAPDAEGRYWLPRTAADSLITSRKPQNKPSSTLEYEAIVRGQNPSISDVGLASEVAKMMAADRDAKLKLTGAQINRANRPPRPPASAAEKPPTASEARALSFYTRAEQAEQTLNSLQGDVSKKGLVDQAVYRYGPNVMQSDANQAYRQAQRQFTEARLRKDSGAAINPAEYENDAKTYFQQPGDGKAVLEQKKKARESVLEALRVEAGRAYRQHASGNSMAGPNPETPAAPKKDPLGIR